MRLYLHLAFRKITNRNYWLFAKYKPIKFNISNQKPIYWIKFLADELASYLLI